MCKEQQMHFTVQRRGIGRQTFSSPLLGKKCNENQGSNSHRRPQFSLVRVSFHRKYFPDNCLLIVLWLYNLRCNPNLCVPCSMEQKPYFSASLDNWPGSANGKHREKTGVRQEERSQGISPCLVSQAAAVSWAAFQEVQCFLHTSPANPSFPLWSQVLVGRLTIVSSAAEQL